MIKGKIVIIIGRIFLYFVLPFILVNWTFPVLGQKVEGLLIDQDNAPIPYASVYVKEIRFGTTTNPNGRFILNLNKGVYTVIFRCLGYETLQKEITVNSDSTYYHYTMNVKPFELAPVTVGKGKEDIAYSIIRKAIAFAPYHLNQVKEFNADVYLKGSLKVKKLSWIVKRSLRKEPDAPKEGQIYLQESINSVHFTAPNTYEQKVKMLRSNFPGDNQSADNIIQFTNASFYQPKIGEIILPLAPYALKYYNYKFVGYSIMENRVINKIQVIPKRESKQLVKGYIYIADDYWNIHELDFVIESLIGTIHLRQTFGEVEKNVWLPVNYYYEVIGKFMGNEGNINYTSAVKFNSIKVNTDIKPPSEIKVIQYEVTNTIQNNTKKVDAKSKKELKDSIEIQQLLSKENLTNREMYKLNNLMSKRSNKNQPKDKSLEYKSPVTVTIDSSARKIDSTQWKKIRPVVLTSEELKVNRDINIKFKTQHDSTNIDTTAKKGNLLLTIYSGHTWRNTSKKRTIKFSGLFSPTEFRFNTVDGFVLGSSASFQKNFNKTGIEINPSAYYAFARKVPMGQLNFKFIYANKNRGLASIKMGIISNDFNQQSGINPFANTVSSLWFGRNYMKLFENRHISLSNRIDPINGLEVNTGVTFSDRRILTNNTDFIFIKTNREYYTSNTPSNSLIDSDNLTNSKAFTAKVGIKYTPFYHYRMVDNRKVMLYSKYPTFGVSLTKAISGVFHSTADFTNVETSISQVLRVGPSNRVRYHAIYGNFLSTKTIYFNDFKHFNTQIIPVVVNGFGHSFLNLNYYRRSTDGEYFEFLSQYQSPYILIKYLPFLSNKIWVENLHFAFLKTNGYQPYYEVGYSVQHIAIVGGIGFFVGFEGKDFYSFGIKASFLLLNSEE
ncbi:MAG TPA: DUF5686 and carboxypeptidase regulatory-like domain-containing protein [Tenuifilaceae bacterium]|nr:DUF5686 and carboxypeptidase regulatory-like domain-containing protein [Tenuifilaceae bacterium]